MKKLYSKTAFSLLELIIASVLVVVVILGIFAINGVLSNNNQDYGQRFFVKSETQTTLNHILKNASLAIGSGVQVTYWPSNTTPDQGIRIGAANMFFSGNPPSIYATYSMCFHQDIPAVPPSGYTIDNAPVNNPPYTAPNYGITSHSQPNQSNTRWLCYTWFPASLGSCPALIPNCTNNIYYCSMPYYETGRAIMGDGDCVPQDNSDMVQSVPVYLGTVYSLENPMPTFTATGGFNITILNCLINSDSTNCNTTGVSKDPADNPEVSISGTVFPPQDGIQ